MSSKGNPTNPETLRQWVTTDEMSKCDPKKRKPTMIYYAAPQPEKYGYFASTVRERRDEFLRAQASQSEPGGGE